MRRTSFLKPVCLFAAMAITPLALGQPTPVPSPTPSIGPGPLSSIRPAFVDTTGRGKPALADPPVSPLVGGVHTGLVGVSLAGIPGAPFAPQFDVSQSIPGGLYDTITRMNHPTETQVVQVTGQQGNRVTQFTMTAFPGSTPPAKAVGPTVQVAGTGFGTGTMHPLSSQGYSNGITLAGTTYGGKPISMDVNFVTSQPGTSGQPEYIGIPYAVLQTVNTLASGVIDPGGQVWVPLTDTNGDGVPDSIQVDLSNQGGPGPTAFYQSQVLVPVGHATNVIPVLSGWGIAGLSLALAAFGLFQLRRGGFSIGI